MSSKGTTAQRRLATKRVNRRDAFSILEKARSHLPVARSQHATVSPGSSTRHSMPPTKQAEIARRVWVASRNDASRMVSWQTASELGSFESGPACPMPPPNGVIAKPTRHATTSLRRSYRFATLIPLTSPSSRGSLHLSPDLRDGHLTLRVTTARGNHRDNSVTIVAPPRCENACAPTSRRLAPSPK